MAMNFANPEAFFLFIPLIAVFLFSRKTGPKLRSRLFVPFSNWVDSRPRFRVPTPFKIFLYFRFLALACLIVGLARPQEVLTKTKRNVDAVDMILSFDLSKSMDAIDFKPDRRTVAIETLKGFIEKRSNDRMGLVLFSGEAYLAVPLTMDHKIVTEAIEKSSNRLLQDGTAIGQSLAVATHHLRNSKAKSRVIILVTDGDNNMGTVDPDTAAELARGYGLKIYTIGLGKKGKVQFPVQRMDPFTGQTITDYQDLYDAVNEELLQEIAQKTGGQFFRAGNQNVLEEIFEKIDALEKSEVQFDTLVRYREKAWQWILAGFLLLILEGILLNTRWRKVP
jgi:Ca-activated chloride channel family protein